MLSLRALAAIISLTLVNLELVTCRSPADGGKAPAPTAEASEVVSLPGVDTSNLTSREKADWSMFVTELLAPCPDQPVSVAECVKQKRDCRLCLPAAQFLATQVREGKARSQIEGAFRKRFAPDQIKTLEVHDSPALGPVNAPVQIVEWADFECPFCGKAAPALHGLVDAYPGQVRLVFKHFPLSIHQHAEKAARAAVAAGKQGKFWEMHARLFAAHAEGKELDDATVKRIAQDLRLDLKKFQDDAASEATADVVTRDRKQADALELSGTPWIYINGRHFDLTHFDLTRDLPNWIETELEAKTGKRPSRVTPSDAGSASAGSDAGPAGAASTKRAEKAP
ncbi:MAG TPA: thioredoxin domain-containing protein [Polyangiaceae bacterium]|nr:thioredoxin domain-containing protein [Polyangiaceae bacterium]